MGIFSAAGIGAGLSSFGNSMMSYYANQPTELEELQLAAFKKKQADDAAYKAGLQGGGGTGPQPLPSAAIPSMATGGAPASEVAAQLAPLGEQQAIPTAATGSGFLESLGQALSNIPMPSAAPQRTNEQVYQDTFTDSFYDGPAPRGGALTMEMNQRRNETVALQSPENAVAQATPLPRQPIIDSQAIPTARVPTPPPPYPILPGENNMAPGAVQVDNSAMMGRPPGAPIAPVPQMPNASQWLPGTPPEVVRAWDNAAAQAAQYPIRAAETFRGLAPFRASVAAAPVRNAFDRQIDEYVANGLMTPDEGSQARLDRIAKTTSHAPPINIEFNEAKDLEALAGMKNSWVNTETGEVGLPAGVSNEQALNDPRFVYADTSKDTDGAKRNTSFYTDSLTVKRRLDALIDETGYSYADASPAFKVAVIAVSKNAAGGLPWSNELVKGLSKTLMSEPEVAILNLMENFASNEAYQKSGAAVTAGEFVSNLMKNLPTFGESDRESMRKRYNTDAALLRMRNASGESGAIKAEAAVKRYWDKAEGGYRATFAKPPAGIDPDRY